MGTTSHIWSFAILGFALSVFGEVSAETKSRKLIYRFTYEVHREQPTGSLFVRVPLPMDEPGKQRLHVLNFDPRPTRILKGPQRYIAEWMAGNGSRTATFSVEIHAELLQQVKTSTPPLSPEDFRRFQQEEPYLELHDRALQETAHSIPDHEKSEAQLKAILTWLTGHLEYTGFDPKDRGAYTALKRRKGDCTEYTDLFVALCRLKGFPARSRLCIQADSVDSPLHSIAEVYLQDRGWITIDPLWSELHGGGTLFPSKNRYLLLNLQRNDPEMFGFFSGISVKTMGSVLPPGQTTKLEISEQLPSGKIETQRYQYGEKFVERDSPGS